MACELTPSPGALRRGQSRGRDWPCSGSRTPDRSPDSLHVVLSASASCLGLWVETPSQSAVTDHCSGAFGRQIVLPDVDSVEARSQAQISPVVHDQFDGSGEATFQLPGLFQHLAGIARFIPVLQERDSTCDQFAGGQAKAFCIRERRRIEDSVKAGKGNHRRLCGAGALARRL